MDRVSISGAKRLNLPIEEDEFDDTETEFCRYRELWVAKLQFYVRAILNDGAGFGITYSEARAWLDTEDFRFTCGWLGYNPENVRKGILVRMDAPEGRGESFQGNEI